MFRAVLLVMLTTLSVHAEPTTFETEQVNACKLRDPTLLAIKYFDYSCAKSTDEKCRKLLSHASATFSDMKVYDLTEPDVIRAFIFIPKGGIFEADDGSGDQIVQFGPSKVTVDYDKNDCSVISAEWDR